MLRPAHPQRIAHPHFLPARVVDDEHPVTQIAGKGSVADVAAGNAVPHFQLQSVPTGRRRAKTIEQIFQTRADRLRVQRVDGSRGCADGDFVGVVQCLAWLGQAFLPRLWQGPPPIMRNAPELAVPVLAVRVGEGKAGRAADMVIG